MLPFFTTTELAYRFGLALADINANTAEMIADQASDVIRDYLQQQVDEVIDETITLYGDGGELIVLPERPVTAVSSVTLAGQPLTSYDWRKNGALRRVIYPGSQFANQQIMVWPAGAPVEVTYSHGYNTVPNTIKAAALELAATIYSNPEFLTEKRVDDVLEKYQAGALMNEQQRAALDRYRSTVDM